MADIITYNVEAISTNIPVTGKIQRQLITEAQSQAIINFVNKYVPILDSQNHSYSEVDGIASGSYSLSNDQDFWNLIRTQEPDETVYFRWLLFRERAITIYDSYDAPTNDVLILNEDEYKNYGSVLLAADIKRFRISKYSNGSSQDIKMNPGYITDDNILLAKNSLVIKGNRKLHAPLYATIGEKFFIVYRKPEKYYKKINGFYLADDDPNPDIQFGSIAFDLSNGNSIASYIKATSQYQNVVKASFIEKKPNEIINYQALTYLKGYEGKLKTYTLDMYGNKFDLVTTGEEPLPERSPLNIPPSSVTYKGTAERLVSSIADSKVTEMKKQINSIVDLSVREQIKKFDNTSKEFEKVPSLLEEVKDDNSENQDVLEALAILAPASGKVGEFISKVKIIKDLIDGTGFKKLEKSIDELENLEQVRGGVFKKVGYVSSRLVIIASELKKISTIPSIVSSLIAITTDLMGFANVISNNTTLNSIPQIQQIKNIFEKSDDIKNNISSPSLNVKIPDVQQVGSKHAPEPVIEIYYRNMFNKINLPINLLINFRLTIKDLYNEDVTKRDNNIPVKRDTIYDVFIVRDYQIDGIGQTQKIGSVTITQGSDGAIFKHIFTNLEQNIKLSFKRVSGDYIYNKESSQFNITLPIKYKVELPSMIQQGDTVQIKITAQDINE